jgi:hypothetical protein
VYVVGPVKGLVKCPVWAARNTKRTNDKHGVKRHKYTKTSKHTHTMSSPPPPPPVECDFGDGFAPAVQRFASVAFFFVVIAVGLVSYNQLPKRGVNRAFLDEMRISVNTQAYYPLMVIEAIIAGFLLAYVVHLAPCIVQNCTSENVDQSNLSALLLLIAWPITTITVAGARFMGQEFYSFLHLKTSKPAADAAASTGTADVSARLFTFSANGVSVSQA